MSELRRENERLRERLAQAEETLNAIRAGEVDALVISGHQGECVLTLAGSDDSYRALIEAMSEGAFVLTARGDLFYANQRLAEMLKTSVEELVGTRFADWIDPGDHLWFSNLLNLDCQQLKRGAEILLVATDGSRLPCQLSGSVLTINAEQSYFSFVATDLSEHKRHEARILAAEKLARSILEQAAEAIVVCDRGARIVRVNAIARNLSLSNPLGQAFEDAFPLRLPGAGRFSLAGHVGTDQRTPFEAELSVADKGYNLLVGIGPWFGADGEALGSIISLTDITERKAAEDEIFHLAFHDALTQLPNRRLLQERLRQILIDSGRNHKRAALVFIDLDNFKTLNDTLGHDVGDLLLQQVSERLLASLREGDMVARLGGDEFVLVLKDLSPVYHTAAQQAGKICAKIQRVISRPYRLDQHEYHATPSLGVTLFTHRESTLDELLKQADLAMYQAKASGRNTLRFFDPAMQDAMEMRARLEKKLREALRLSQFSLHYQPQVDRSSTTFGAEALLRWNDPDEGMISPGRFIPLAEDTALILPIGQWVLEHACSRLAAWAKHRRTADLVLSVNVSAQQFRQTDFVEQVRAALDKHGIDGSRLTLELTESLLLKDVADAREKMKALREDGVEFSLDDFGTGYSSLAYLKRLPLNQLKIDQSFVHDLIENPNDAAIVDAIIALARSLGMQVIAEGVETGAQHDFLLDHGCDAFQGYLFGRPTTYDSLTEALTA